ncbi:hypothetical protein NDU88_003105 [Pleurodeles waltl]|uniref:Uncharacterized protein n=1 Tax=Pleurodeles waltl TaxID=8319 RepID=A0AAV7WN40_PLEWA|nr:hypothetical protein NDU88_003104 [Pleurodeles waltl]KAJ1215497.1 hypothetical protein NDU88_003105 [Pleurodeles waltl]
MPAKIARDQSSWASEDDLDVVGEQLGRISQGGAASDISSQEEGETPRPGTTSLDVIATTTVRKKKKEPGSHQDKLKQAAKDLQ